jgi:multidrug efflux pump subunit AcrB
MAELPSHPARFADGRTTMKNFVLSIAFSVLVAVAVSPTAQAAYYHHRHHHYWHHGGGGSYWNYYRVSWPGRGTSEQSQR